MKRVFCFSLFLASSSDRLYRHSRSSGLGTSSSTPRTIRSLPTGASARAEYEQLIRTYDQVRGQLDHLRAMARQVPVNMIERYRACPRHGGPSSPTTLMAMPAHGRLR